MATSSVFTDLPNTVLLDVFQYLSPIDCYRSMHNINQTLDGIIRYGTTHINLSKIESRRDFNYHLEHILPDVITSLRFLKISNDFLSDKEQEDVHTEGRAIMIGIIKKVQAKVDLNAYKKLEELRLKNIDGTQLKLISEKLIHMSQLKRLVISFYGTTADFFTSVIDSAIIRSKLKTLNLALIDANVLFLNRSFHNTLSNLDYLTVESCIIGNVAVLFKLVQNIKYLDISIWNYPDQRETYLTDNLTLPNLTYFKLKVDEIKWSFLEHLLKQCGKQLTHLTLEASGYLDFINSSNWERLIQTHLRQLTKFQFRITLWEASISDINLNSFNTDFWHRLNVYIACDWIKCSSEGEGDIVDVYTVPFCRSSFLTAVSTVNVISPLMNSSYNRIQTLTILLDEKPFHNSKRIYENVDSIILNSMRGHNNNILPFLNISINCSQIHHLGFSSVRGVLKSQIFYQLLQECSNLYSLRLHSEILKDMTNKFTDEKICSLLNKLIKHLQFNSGLEQEDFDEQTTKKFVQTFTNLERIYVEMKSPDDILRKLSIMINDMKVLNKIFIKTTKTLPNGFIDQTRQSILDLKECYIRKEKSFLFIWR